METPRAFSGVDRREQRLHLMEVQRRGGLVEEEDLGVLGHCLGDLHELLLVG